MDENNSSKTVIANTFWECIHVLITKPHVVNKRLWGCTVLYKHRFKCTMENLDIILDNIKFKNCTNMKQFFTDLVKDFNVQIVDDTNGTEVEMILVELLPKNYMENHAFQLIFLEKYNMLVRFIDVTPEELKQNLCPRFSYNLHLKNNKLSLQTPPGVSEKSVQWLKGTLLPQVTKWSTEIMNNEANKVCTVSLALVSQDKYYTKYNHLKLKYGKEMVKIWPECTDPKKFVYEDVAIATYLLLLWEEEKYPQSFVDVGCGNGLLVYILTMEGHNGLGLDVRKRKIWDMYPSNIKLKEMTITPSNITTFSKVDWIIGNHSDELTPWIPVITARNSYKCNFFLLPCCAYNLDGTKYQRQNSSKSQYTEYLEHIHKLCESFGFVTKFDRLKIPSTKRICLISTRRTYEEDEYDKYCTIIQEIVNMQIGCHSGNVGTKIKDFKSRNPVQEVRNCTQIDKDVTEFIIKLITSYLTEGCHLKLNWSTGKKVQINDLAQRIPVNKLKALKSEFGGLQTLLRNNHQIFDVQKGYVQLRFPRTINEVKQKRNYNNDPVKVQVKKCWFYTNHPQGCPLDSSTCSFLHESQ